MFRRLYLGKVLLILGLIYLGFGVYLFIRQDHYVFMPLSRSPVELMERAKRAGFEPWARPDGSFLGWKSIEGNEDNVLLVFGGQGDTSLHCTGLRNYCQMTPENWKIYLLEYPGYGMREGTPSEESLTAAGVEALDQLSKPGRKIWLLGVSLGSGVACAAVHGRSQATAGLLLLTPYDSLIQVAASYFPWFPVAPLFRAKFNSVKNLRDYPGPVAFFICAKDTSVPAVRGQTLYDSYPGIKKLWIEPGADHDVSPVLNTEWGRVVEWLQKPKN